MSATDSHAPAPPRPPLQSWPLLRRLLARFAPYRSAATGVFVRVLLLTPLEVAAHAVAPASPRAQGMELLSIFRSETGAEPRLWGPSIVGFGHLRYTYATGHSGEMARVGFSPRKAALPLYVLTLYGSTADLL